MPSQKTSSPEYMGIFTRSFFLLSLKEAEKIGEVAALEAKINFIEGKIKKCYETMTIFERDDVKEFCNPLKLVSSVIWQEFDLWKS